MLTVLQAKLTTVATFPKNYFLENLVVRSDNSILITALNHKELWYVPPSRHDSPIEPLLLFTFSQLAMGIVEAEPEVFYISTSDIYTSHESYLHRLDLRGSAHRHGGRSRSGPSLSGARPRSQRKLCSRAGHHSNRRLLFKLDLACRPEDGRRQANSSCVAET